MAADKFDRNDLTTCSLDCFVDDPETTTYDIKNVNFARDKTEILSDSLPSSSRT